LNPRLRDWLKEEDFSEKEVEFGVLVRKVEVMVDVEAMFDVLGKLQ
jgi:hypothetical protein